MHLAELTESEQRVLGCLLEKRWTTPDQYPLSLNALRQACNQLTNRDPVTDYDETTVREAAERLSRYGLARLASGHGSRAIKYRHLAEDGLSLGREELAVLAVLLLRGPQTPGELKARTERMANLESLAAVERVLETLIARGYARRIGRRPGQKEDRFTQLLGGETDGSAAPPDSGAAWSPNAASSANAIPAAASSAAASPTASSANAIPAPASPTAARSATASPTQPADADTDIQELVTRLDALEDEVSALREELSTLRAIRADVGVTAPD